ncbi:hypothetical protein H5410_004367 [Solanum commersonii]|uniref:Uncharacterized protein n=1 Tax=Solanum commersonii TaxID=4109 RepID=A0A9J6B7T8_SOLCO|nr:hypothetical protein H5410_004367 [Solanum commersonii]
MSYFELRDYIRELRYSTTCTFSVKALNSGILIDVDNDNDILDMMCSLEDVDVVDVFVKHLVDEPIMGPMLIENGSHVDMGESDSTFNTRPSESENLNFGVGENYLNSEDLFATFSTSPPFTTTPFFKTADGATADVVVDDDIDVGLAGPDFSEEEVGGSDYSTEDSVESEVELVGDDDEEEYDSDVHEEVRELRGEKKTFQRRKRRERVPADNKEVPVGEAGPDLGFDETGTCKVSHEGRLGGDEPYFASSNEDSFELDEDECCDDDDHESENNMSECFNVSILAARHKTIFTILEEIRVKIMTRIANLREFPSTWKCNFSPMALKVLEENISRSMDCTIGFNGVVGFEVKEGLRQHKVDIARRTCSYRPGMPRSKIYSTGQAKVTRSSDVTGDIGYTPSNTSKLKWNGKAAISTSKLHELREKQRKKTMGSSSNNPS